MTPEWTAGMSGVFDGDVEKTTERYRQHFPAGFFDRADRTDDGEFYAFDRFVTHIDDEAIAALGELYAELGLGAPAPDGHRQSSSPPLDPSGEVLDVCSSWISHFATPPTRLVALGMNANELAANKQAAEWVVHNLNTDPTLPFEDDRFGAVTCAVSVDYLARPLEVFDEVKRVLRPGGMFVCSFSNRCFPTKVIRGWLATDDRGRMDIVARYFELTDGFGPPTKQHRNPGARGDPLYAVWATVLS